MVMFGAEFLYVTVKGMSLHKVFRGEECQFDREGFER